MMKTMDSVQGFGSEVDDPVNTEKRTDAELVKASGLFDAAYYIKQLEDPSAEGWGESQAIEHYLKNGHSSQLSPSQAFDAPRYLDAYRDVASAGLNPLVHFLKYGQQEGRQAFGHRPTRGLDAEQDPLTEAHALATGWFDEAFYLERYPSIRESRYTAWEHYCLYGGKEGRWPCHAFDGRYYREKNPDCLSGYTTPLHHYLDVGCKKGMSPSPFLERLDQERLSRSRLSELRKLSEILVLINRSIKMNDWGQGEILLGELKVLCDACDGLLTKDDFSFELRQYKEAEYNRACFEKRWLDAENSMRNLLEHVDDNAQIYNLLAQALRKQGKWWQEVEALKSAIALEEHHSSWHYRLGEALEVMNRFQEAAATYGSAIELKNGKAEAAWHYRQGYCFEREGHDGPPDPQAAEKAYRLAIEKDSKLNAKRFGIGVFHQQRGHWAQAREAYQKQLRVSPLDPELYYRLGMAYDRCYEWENAESYYKKALAGDIHQANWHYRLGFVLERQEKFSEAAVAYQYAALNRETHTPYWFYRWAYVLEQQGRYEEAAQAYLQTRQQQTLDAPSVSEADASPEQGTAQTQPAEKNDALSDYAGQFDNQQFIIDVLERHLEKDTTDPGLWYQLGNAYERQGNWGKAADAYQHAVNRKNDHTPAWYYRLGYVLTQAGQYNQACEALRSTRLLNEPYGVSEEKFNKDSGFRQSAIYTSYYENLPVHSEIILYESFHGVSMSCNPYAMFLYLISSEQYSNWMHVWVVNDLSKVQDDLKRLKNVFFIKRDSDAYLRHLASAGYLINNSTFPGYFIRKDGQAYLNTWHGTPWKTLGKDIKNNQFEYANTARNFLQATHLISPNSHTTKVLLERYDVSHLYSGMVAETGYPRIDLTLKVSESKKIELRKLLGLSPGDPIVLYAPTWRGKLGEAKEETDKIYAEIKAIQSLGVQVVFRGHYFVETGIKDTDLSHVVAPDEVNTNELLSVADCLVTDYSSVAFDFMVTSKPIIFFIEDYEEYSRDRGLYFKPEEMPGDIAYTIDELTDLLPRALSSVCLHEKYEKAKKLYTANENGRVSEAVVEFLFRGNVARSKVVTYKKNRNILIYGGEFQPNGITTSFINLANNVDSEKVTLTLTYDPNAISGGEERLEQFSRLPQHVCSVPRVGRMNRTIEEHWVETKMNQHNGLQTEGMRQVYAKMFAREFKRIYGGAEFDAAVQFTGYGRFWSALFGCSTSEALKVKSIYQHNDKYGEWSLRFPTLESVFNLYRYYDNMVSVSELTRDLNQSKIAELFGLESRRFVFADNLQNPQEVLARANEPLDPQDQVLFDQASHVFITLGRLSLEKDHEKLIRSFLFVLEQEPAAKLLILGDGPLKQNLTRLVNELGLSSSVFLLGRRFNPFPLLKRADCFVLSSNHEGQPMVLFEAMILKKPIISTDIVGSRSVIEGRTGHLVENTAEGLAHGMLDFVAGKINFPEYDITDYQKEAINMFYAKVSGLEKVDA